MYPIRTAPRDPKPKDKPGRSNAEIQEVAARTGETNLGWLARNKHDGGIVLLGGTSLADFRLRVAQSHLRDDLTPSCWSQAAIWPAGSRELLTVPLDFQDLSRVPARNGLERRPLAVYDDPDVFPNLAVFQFTKADASEVADAVARMSRPAPRATLDVPALILPWLAFVWGAGDAGNPILKGTGIPSAAFVQTVFAVLGHDLAPGVPPAASCPEAIWQAAKWWHPVYRRMAQGKQSKTIVPKGSYVRRQRFAALKSEPDPEPGAGR